MTKRALLASGLGLALVAAPGIDPAMAADWNGFYIGAHAGGVVGDVDVTNVSNTTVDLFFSPGQNVNFKPDGVLGGAQLGFNYMLSNWLIGVDVTGSGLDFDETKLSPFIGDERFATSIDWTATAALRLGMSWDDSLIYVRGGYAAGKIAVFHSDTVDGFYDSDDIHNGFVVGAGFEHMIGKDVSVGLEYNYIDLASKDQSGVCACAGGGGPGTVVNDVSAQLHTVTARLNWYLYHP
jgi:outer membrane immunogenic protein